MREIYKIISHQCTYQYLFIYFYFVQTSVKSSCSKLQASTATAANSHVIPSPNQKLYSVPIMKAVWILTAQQNLTQVQALTVAVASMVAQQTSSSPSSPADIEYIDLSEKKMLPEEQQPPKPT